MESTAFQKILNEVGGCGRWQKTVFLWTTIGVTLTAFHNLSSVFLVTTPDFHCKPPSNVNALSENTSLSAWIPRDPSSGRWSQCERFFSAGNVSHVVPCDSWQFLSENRHTWTVAMHWSLVCQRRWLVATVQSTYMLGSMFGALADGLLSDHFGRKWTACVSALVLAVSSLATAASSSSFALFVALRFVTAMAQAGVFGSMFVLCLEIVGGRWRALVGLSYELPFAVGFMLLAVIAYWVRHWQFLQLVISAPSLLLLVYWYVLPESPRWLALNGRLEEALTVLQKAAKMNGRSLADSGALQSMLDDFCASEQTHSVGIKRCGESSGLGMIKTCCSAFVSVHQLLTTPRMRLISLASFTNWLVVALVYYGVTFDTAELSSNRYLAIFLSGLVEIPAYLLAIPAANHLGRRLSVILSHGVTAAAILLILVVPDSHSWLRLALGLGGKFAATACFGILYLYAAEYFPTTVRTIGVGASSMCARVGSVLAPVIVQLFGNVHWAIPSAVFGISACVAALVALALPETNQQPMPDTVQGIEDGHWQKTLISSASAIPIASDSEDNTTPL